jgi:hypothetical protein
VSPQRGCYEGKSEIALQLQESYKFILSKENTKIRHRPGVEEKRSPETGNALRAERGISTTGNRGPTFRRPSRRQR